MRYLLSVQAALSIGLGCAIIAFIIPVSFAGSIVGIGLGATLCVLAALALYSREFICKIYPFGVAGIPLVLIAGISMFRAGDVHALFGSTDEWGTLASFILFAFAIIAGSYLTPNTRSFFLYGVEAAGALGSFAAAAVWAGRIPGDLFAGSWTQLSLALCAAAFVGAVMYDGGRDRSYRFLHAAAAILCLGGFIIFFLPAAAIAGVCAALAIAYRMWQNGTITKSRFPLACALLSLALIVLLLFGMRAPLAAVQGDARPSFLATELIVGPEYLGSLPNVLIGTGPGTFAYVWNKYRPVEVNATSLWDFTPQYSYAAIMTLAAEDGLLGMFAYLFCVFLLLGRYVVSPNTENGNAPESGAMFSLAVFSCAAAILYPAGTGLFVVGAIALGSCARDPELSVSIRAPALRPVLVLFSIAIFCGGAFCVWTSGRQLLAAWYDARGTAMLDAGNTDAAGAMLAKAAEIWGASEYSQDASVAYGQQAVAELDTAKDAASLTTAEGDATLAMMFSDASVQAAPEDFSAWLLRASLYLVFAQRDVAGAAEKAQQSLVQAAALSPTRPDVPYLTAQLALALGDTQIARSNLEEALSLKPDYKDAADLLSTLPASP